MSQVRGPLPPTGETAGATSLSLCFSSKMKTTMTINAFSNKLLLLFCVKFSLVYFCVVKAQPLNDVK